MAGLAILQIMTRRIFGGRLDLPNFDQPQKASPCDTRWTYEQAIAAFEEIAAEWRLQETPVSRQTPSDRPFELRPSA